jgi:chemotaxis protein MotA
MKSVNSILALLVAVVFMILLHIGFKVTFGDPDLKSIHRIFILLGGNIGNGGYIQFFTYVAFSWGLLDIVSKRKKNRRENTVFTFNLLPTGETHLLMPNDIRTLIDVTRVHEKEGGFILTDMIKKACIKFRANHSIPEMIEIISIQTDINKEKDESAQSLVRYLTWGIPSLGFIGTVLGISQALTIASSGNMEEITAVLGVAFDTTLVSLVLSIIIMWYFHKLQEETDNLHAHVKEYTIENLVNRIET